MKNNSPYTDTTTRKYQNSNYEKTKEGWVKKVEQTEAAAAQASPADTKKEYTDEELAEYAKKASDEALRKAGSGRDERMRIAAKKEILRRKNEGMPEPEKTDNPFDEGMEKGWFDEFPTKVFGGKEYINKGQGWEVLEKARAAVGEIRTWSGEKYQKTATGWKYIGKADGGAKPAAEKKEDKNVESSFGKLMSKSDEEIAKILQEAVGLKASIWKRGDKQAPSEGDFWFSTNTEDVNNGLRKRLLIRPITKEGRERLTDDSVKKKLKKLVGTGLGAWSGRGADGERVFQGYNIWEPDADFERKKSFGEALKANAQEFITKKNEIKAQLLDTIKSQVTTGVLTEEEKDRMKIRLAGDGRMEISGISKSRWEDVVVYYDKRWRDEGRDYKVQTTAFGSVKPGSEEAKIVAMQAQCLSNPELITAIKDSIEKVDEAKKAMQVQTKELEAKYPDYRESEVWDEYGSDINDWY